MSDVLLTVLPLVVFFVGLYVFVKVSQFRRSRSTEVVDPHVVVEVPRDYAGSQRYIYKCELCGKERERKEFFYDEDCDEFEANP